MTAEEFFNKFALLANTPNAVGKMRELILGLAVQGKLIPQSPDDEPAKVLIVKATAHALSLRDAARRKQLIAEWESRAVSPDFILPSNWVWTCNAVAGDTSPRVECDDNAMVAFAPMNLMPTDYRTPLVPEIRAWRDIKKGYTHFADGDVAIAKITPCFQNGKGCVFANLPGGVGAGTTELHVLRPYPGVVLPLYALLWFKSPEFVSRGVATFTGTAGQQRVSNDYFRFRPFPLPPLPEQKRIVAKVDELMRLCDRLDAQQNERTEKHSALARASLSRFAETPTPANLEFLFHKSYAIDPVDLRKAILTAGYEGALVPADKTDASEILRVISDAASSRQEFWLQKYGASRKAPEPAGLAQTKLPSVAQHWQWASLDSVCRQITDGEHIQPPYQNSGMPMLSAKHVRDGFVEVDGAGLISKEAFEKSIERCKPENGDILIVSVGATTGRSALVTDCSPFAIVRSVLLVKPAIKKEFLLWWFKHPWAFWWMTQASGASAQPHLYIRDLKRMPVPIPPLAEQRRIVAKVDQLMAFVDQLEAQLAAARSTAEKLMEAIVVELTASSPDPARVHQQLCLF